MRYFPRAPRTIDISLLLKVCPSCLGDLVFASDVSGNYYRCLQCNERAVPRESTARLERLALRQEAAREQPPALTG